MLHTEAHQLEAAEIWFLSRMLNIPWPAKKSNEVLKETVEKRKIIVLGKGNLNL
jgi:hypothetical protein